MLDFDIAVIGAGHAGCEAALAAARLGCRTLICVMNVDTIGALSCNPAIGGLAKGHLVREIDALGGEMAKNIDATAIQFRRLNTSKGPAVRSSRAQADRLLYRLRMTQVLENQSNLAIRQAVVDEILVENGQVWGLRTSLDEVVRVRALIVATGTFLNGLVHVGMKNFSAGRLGDFPSTALAQWFKAQGFNVGRMKTGTVPRLDSNTIDYSQLEAQYSDNPVTFFSFSTPPGPPPLPQRACHITYTTEATHEIIRGSIDQSPMYAGVIEGIGARYCPSVEDKIMRFPDKNRHQIFLEPEGLDTVEVYPNGISTSLPFEVQIRLVHSIPGLEATRIIRPGYAIEYDFIDPRGLKPSLETKAVRGLFFAGQINGSSGYEEAAAQGLMAGINSVRYCREQEALVLDRSQAYIGVLIDDLVTLGTKEPYRLFTSRAEYRLLLREDNADMRLCPIGKEIGLLGDAAWQAFSEKQDRINACMDSLRSNRAKTSPAVNNKLATFGSSALGHGQALSLEELLRRPELNMSSVAEIAALLEPPCTLDVEDSAITDEIELQVKYAGYIQRQEEQVERFRRLERMELPQDFSYKGLPGLSNEVVEKLSTIQPRSLGQAARISGVTPAAIAVLQVHLKRLGRM
ncbi:MAG: tRNA uridine-5-carboxymethylaminomethyl(34) synthesis enzyme MnmG [Desulfobulbaceae bacterium]|nr:tRNA uridine-5-carboxymethylaminomethyl(34) synthesis enzyme MnmG [Desulfobulbaceae bacterium]